MQKAIDNLKNGPKDDKTAVAGGIAGVVVAILLVGWALFFFRSLQSGSRQLEFGGVQDKLHLPQVKEAQQQLQQRYSDTKEELLEIRDTAAAQQVGAQQQQTMQIQGQTETNQFSGSDSGQY